jgi:hypothetical protein
MKQVEAKLRILQEWNRWAAEDIPKGQSAPGEDGPIFYGHLQRTRVDLLDFRAAGDKWPLVHGWLLRAGKIPN